VSARSWDCGSGRECKRQVDFTISREGILLSRLRKLVFKIRQQTPAARFAESMRRVNRLARLMSVIQAKGRRKMGG